MAKKNGHFNGPPIPRLAAHVVAPIIPGLAVCGEVGRVLRGDRGVQLDDGAALQAGETHLGPMDPMGAWDEGLGRCNRLSKWVL